MGRRPPLHEPESLAKARLEVIEGDAVEEVRGELVAARADDQDDAVELHQFDGRGRASRHDTFRDTAKQTRFMRASISSGFVMVRVT
jgi:hypothetical protein